MLLAGYVSPWLPNTGGWAHGDTMILVTAHTSLPTPMNSPCLWSLTATAAAVAAVTASPTPLKRWEDAEQVPRESTDHLKKESSSSKHPFWGDISWLVFKGENVQKDLVNWLAKIRCFIRHVVGPRRNETCLFLGQFSPMTKSMPCHIFVRSLVFFRNLLPIRHDHGDL